MSYSVMLNSNSVDAKNMIQIRSLLVDLCVAYDVNPANLAGLNIDIVTLDNLNKWIDKLIKLMNVVGNTEDITLEPAGLN